MSEPKKPRVVFLSTGGTIASESLSSTETEGYSKIGENADSLIGGIKEIEEYITPEPKELFRKDSTELETADLLILAKEVNAALAREEVDGVVVTHGTDTMEESAFFLHLTVKSKKPVVLTGSMRPSGVISADGPMNLFNAALAAGDKESVGKGVTVCFADRLFCARDVTKVSTFHTDAFQSAECGPIGTVVGRARYDYVSTRPHTSKSEFDTKDLKTLPKVQIVYTHLDCDGELLKACLESDCEGIVLAGMGNGTLPPKIREILKTAPQNGPVIVRASRVKGGLIGESGSCPDDVLGTVKSGGFNPQKARILLQLALTKTKDKNEIRRIFETY